MGLEEIIAKTSVNILIIATILLVALAAISLHAKKLKEGAKKFLFISIILTTLIPTLYMAVATVYINTISSSQGPVHWHADIEIWSCGKELELQDPKGMFSNKIGTATLHEHNDKRIHLEGVVVHPEDASLGKFFQVIGGDINADAVTVPTNNGLVYLNNGTMCPDGTPGEIQTFVYQTDKDHYYKQIKVSDPNAYIMSPYSAVPEGDCIIVEFGEPKDRTDKMCRSYKVAEQIGKLKGERN